MAEQELPQSGYENGIGGLGPEDERGEALNRFRSAGSIAMTPELFEKLYLTPETRVKGNLRKTFANPTPVALVGFVMSLSPLSADLMGWRGAGQFGAATVGVYIFMGGLLMFTGAILEWVLGNTFASVVFFTFGGYWFAFGATLIPSFAAYSTYAPAGSISGAVGITTKGFNASLSFWLLFMGIICLLFLVCATRTNIVFVVIFFSLMLAFFLLTGAFFLRAENIDSKIANRCLVGAGASAFVTSMAGWYLLTSILLATVDFPISLPVGDLSTVVLGRSQRMGRGSRGVVNNKA